MKTILPEIFSQGKKISAILSMPTHPEPSKVVIMLHGGPGGNKTGPGKIFETMALLLADSGIGSIRFDFLGEGESEGRYQDMTFAKQRSEYQQVLRFARGYGFQSIGVLAESFGAATAIAEYSYDVSCLGLLWPTIDLADTSFKDYLTPSRLKELAASGVITDGQIRIGAAFIDELMNQGNILHLVGKISSPTTIFHGNADREVPIAQSVAIYDRLSQPKKLTILDGAGHAIDDPKLLPSIADSLIDWFTQHL